jgi:translocation and assembly module TamB
MAAPVSSGNLSTKTRRRLAAWIIVAVVLLGCAVGLTWYLRSPEFNDLVRQKVVLSIEDATGGHVELGSFHWNLSQLDFEATDLSVHGLEPSNVAPLARVSRVHVRAHLVSLLRRRVDLTYLGLDRPQIHIIVDRNGKTNVPEPKGKSTSFPSAREH